MSFTAVEKMESSKVKRMLDTEKLVLKPAWDIISDWPVPESPGLKPRKIPHNVRVLHCVE